MQKKDTVLLRSCEEGCAGFWLSTSLLPAAVWKQCWYIIVVPKIRMSMLIIKIFGSPRGLRKYFLELKWKHSKGLTVLIENINEDHVSVQFFFQFTTTLCTGLFNVICRWILGLDLIIRRMKPEGMYSDNGGEENDQGRYKYNQ